MGIKDKIKAAKDVKTEILDIAEWDTKIEVRSMTGRDRARMFDLFLDDKGNLKKAESYPFVVMASCYDPETGARVFEESDMEWIAEKNAAILDQIINTAFKLSGLGGKAAVDEAVKN